MTQQLMNGLGVSCLANNSDAALQSTLRLRTKQFLSPLCRTGSRTQSLMGLLTIIAVLCNVSKVV